MAGRVARFWNKLPWELSCLDNDQVAKLFALYQIEQDIEMYYNSEQARRMDQDTKK